VGYGQSLFIGTPDGAAITKVAFIRFGSVTHAFDAGTRFVPLSFSQVSGGVQVTLPRAYHRPARAVHALPGERSGVPSVSRTMLLR